MNIYDYSMVIILSNFYFKLPKERIEFIVQLFCKWKSLI